MWQEISLHFTKTIELTFTANIWQSVERQENAQNTYIKFNILSSPTKKD